jgi:hypothetical protein
MRSTHAPLVLDAKGGTCICRTLENRSKAIPCGTYNIENSKSPKFKRELPLIYGYKVAESRGIRIHAGNTSKDSSGCVLVGMGRDIAPEFEGRFDMVSISLNTDTAEKYDALCHPVQANAYEAMKTFAKEVQKYVPKVMMTVVDTIPQEEIEACRRICEDEIGAIYRVREYIED